MEIELAGRFFDAINLTLNVMILAICLYVLIRVKQANGYHKEFLKKK
jgi:F0F1-type ATP synthase membrane subunit a